MKTFLELVNDVERESGTVQILSRTTDVASPGTSRQEKIIEHVRKAYENLQNARRDWPWRQIEFSHAMTVGQSRYTAAQLGVTSFARWLPANDEEVIFRLYDNSVGLSDESPLCPLPYGMWRERYDTGTHDANRPIDYSIDRQNKLCVGSKPDKAYVLRGVCVAGLSSLLENEDVPILPPDHHGVIVWEALKLLHGHDEGQFALGNAISFYNREYRNLVNDCLPQVEL